MKNYTKEVLTFLLGLNIKELRPYKIKRIPPKPMIIF